ncbi:MAG: hypothetical protein JWN82_458 [Candidatus Saccharibacteria bacterium]|nr:hypothetical protein [Candidatus Saccharibacteria bacterium]
MENMGDIDWSENAIALIGVGLLLLVLTVVHRIKDSRDKRQASRHL